MALPPLAGSPRKTRRKSTLPPRGRLALARVPGRTASQWHKSKRGRPRNREPRKSCHREHPLWVPRHVRLDPVGRVPYRRPPPTARHPTGTRSTARRPRARARMERHRSRTARIRRPRTKGTPRTGRAPAHRQRPLDLSPPLSGTGPTAPWAASQAAGTPPNRSGTPPPLVGEAAVAPVPKTAPYSTRRRAPRRRKQPDQPDGLNAACRGVSERRNSVRGTLCIMG